MNRNILLTILIILFSAANASAFWIWTPETNKWVNPKYSVKETPIEQLELARDYYKKKDYKEAIKEFNKLIKHYPKAVEAPEAQYYIGLCLEEQDEFYEAVKEYQVVIDKYPFSERSAEIVKRQYDIGEKLLEGRKDRSKFIEAIAGTNYDVIDIFRKVIKNAPYGELAPPAQYKIGLYLLEKGLFQEARDEFEKVLNDYPDNEWSKAAKYQIAISDSRRSTNVEYDQKITQSAVEEFKEFVDIYPDAELSREAKKHIQTLRDKEAKNAYMIAQFYEKQQNYKAAKIYYQAVVDEHSNSKWSSKALVKIREMTEKIE
ncbi:MAG: outer membrane protein assembly factor BamD [Candidatus Omnitrophica bacterium]|nr:outer membrane protein assembly factor BamD [Candidatus Omnitrophota bacterium]